MKLITQYTLLACTAAALVASSSQTMAQQQGQRQGRGNFDPAQMRERMMTNLRERLDVKSDDEWKVMEPRLATVMEARTSRGGGAMMAMMGPRRGGGDTAAAGNAPRRGGPGGQASPEVEALQKAIEDNAPAADIKAKLTAVREARKANDAKLKAAQEQLRGICNMKQEAILVMMGMLE